MYMNGFLHYFSSNFSSILKYQIFFTKRNLHTLYILQYLSILITYMQQKKYKYQNLKHTVQRDFFP